MRMVLVSLLALFAATPLPAQEAPVLRYQLEVILQGSRSQGLRGALFDANGAALAPADAKTVVETGFGSFQSVECLHSWSICGWLEVGTVQAMPVPYMNSPSLEGASMFRVVALTRDGATVHRGELLDGASTVPVQDVPVTNALGVFRPVAAGADFEGWLPETWSRTAAVPGD
jgi:hypothetical protein